MSEQEHEQRDEPAEDREETIQDLEVPEEESKDVAGGRKAGGKQDEY